MRTARVIDNLTLMATACVPLDLPDGREAVSIIVKATWLVDDEGALQLPLVPRPVRRSGVPRFADRASSMLYPSDVAPLKLGTDVLVVGTAVPPDSQATQTSVALRVANADTLLVDKEVQVFGPRVWKRGVLNVTPGSPEPLVPTALSWENTYGGTLEGDDFLYEPQNPVGSGIARDPSDLVGQAVPPIESRAAPLGSKRPVPAGMGPVETSWEPRASRFGTPDARWRRERAPIYPHDFDPRYFCCAPDDQWLADPLEAGVSVEVRGVRRRPWRFRLPTGRPRLICRMDGLEEERRPNVDTVLIDADAGRLELCWRSSFILPRKSERLERVQVRYDQPIPETYMDDLSRRYREARTAREVRT